MNDSCLDGLDNDGDLLYDSDDPDCAPAPGDVDGDGDGFTPNAGDCNDGNAAINPDATEVCGNGVDENCDGVDDTCAGDVDGDLDGFTPNQGDCNDGNAAINPAATEQCGNSVDENCDGVAEACPPAPGDVDGDNDGFTPNAGDCNDGNPAVNPGATEICGNGVDENCDGVDDTCAGDVDNDNDGFTPNQGDCNDSNAAVNPGATEIPYNGVDDDCNSQTLDNDLDRDGFGNPTDCNDGNPAINPAASENCTDGIDNDCDGLTDANDPDCKVGSGLPPDHTDEEDGFMHKPGKDEPYSNGCTLCHGSDLTGDIGPSCFSCHDRDWHEDPIPENCTDGIDNDGDRAIDCADSDCATDEACAQQDPEVCDDEVDNDGDRAIDCADSDCATDEACAQPEPDDDEPGTHPFGGWTDAEEEHEDYVEDNGVGDCTSCHGADLTGGEGPSCFSCHGAEWIDEDGDSVSDEKEKGHGRKDDHYDGNKDGKPDKGQKKVASFPTSSGNHYLTVESTADIEQVESSEPEGGEAAGFNLPYGEMEFTISGVEPGGFATVTIYTDGEYVDTYYLFDKNGSAREFTYDSASETGAVVGAFDVTLHLVDGGAGDSDATANGSISVAGAPASTAPAMELTTPAPGSAGGCAIVDRDGSTTGIKGALGLLLLAGIWFAARRRKRKAPGSGK